VRDHQLRLNWSSGAILNIAVLDVKSTSREDTIAHCNTILIIPFGENLFSCGSSPGGIPLRPLPILTLKVPMRVTRQIKQQELKLIGVVVRCVQGDCGSPVWSGGKKVVDAGQKSVFSNQIKIR